MNSLYRILTLVVVMLTGFSTKAQFQHSFGVGGQGSSSFQNVVISFSPTLKIKPSGALRWKSNPLKSEKVHLLEGHRTRLSFEILPQSLPNGAILRFEVSTAGNFSLARSSNSRFELKLDDNNPSWPEVDFASSGIGQVKFKLIEAQVAGVPFEVDQSRNTASFSYELIYFEEALAAVKKVPATKTPHYLKQISAFHDTWDKIFNYVGWENNSRIAHGIIESRVELDKMFKSMQSNTTKGTLADRLAATAQLYQLFHNIPGSHHAITTYGIDARSAMNDLDEAIWNSLDQNDLTSLDSYLVGIDDIEDYVSAHGVSAATQFNTLVDAEYQRAQSDGSKQAYCDFYNLVKGTLFAKNNPGDNRIKTAISKCNISPCEAACNSGDCEAVLTNCDESDPCYQKCKRAINSTLLRKACQEQFLALETAFSDKQTNFGEIQLLITQLREDCSTFLSSDQLARIDTIEQQIEPCIIEFAELSPEKITDKEFSFKLLVVSGVQVTIESLDDQLLPAPSVDSLASEIHFSWQDYPVKLIWIIPDSLFKVVITDGKSHQALFRAASGDSVILPLDQAEFTARANISETELTLQLENGSGPFWLEWHSKSGEQVIYQALDSREEMINIETLPETYSGAYFLVVRDRFGRKIRLAEELTIEHPFSFKLWHGLLIPLLLIVAFLLYRNIFSMPKPSTL